MSKIKNWMMDIEEFCNGYAGGAEFRDFIADEIVEDAEMYFKSIEAAKYARQYLTEQLGE